MGEKDFKRLAVFILSYGGIQMPATKSSMVEGRLRKRLRELGMDSFTEYCDYLFDHGAIEGEEGVYLIDAVTTNKTDFFREPKHFTHMIDKALPSLLDQRSDRPVRVWSAASSTGAEAYTIAMILDNLSRTVTRFKYDVIGTDICTEVLEQARKAIYPMSMIDSVPHEWRHRYFLRSTSKDNPTIRLRPEIRHSVRFGRLNLMDDVYPLDGVMDIVFCRNILIYFERSVQEKVLNKICQNIRPGGYLYIGHGESITGMTLPVKTLAPSVFRRE